MPRTVGTLVPLRSLRSSQGALAGETHGTFATGTAFLEWLRATGQDLWQLLPLAETHLEPGSATTRVPSPYRGYGVGLDPQYVPTDDMAVEPTVGDLEAFRASQAAWLEDLCLFSAIRDAFGTDDWRSWPPALRDRDPDAIAAWRTAHADAVSAHELTQWRAHRSFGRLRTQAREFGIRLSGDLSFYLPLQSPLVWANRGAFRVEPDGSLAHVSGVPDSPDSHFGRQVWGHPLYDWTRAEEVLSLWRLRIAHSAVLYDMVRFDHVKGFYRHGAVHASDPSKDHYVDGPGTRALEPLVRHARSLGLATFAEDSGMYVHGELVSALERLSVPGIRILRFAFNERAGQFSAEHAAVRRYPSLCVAYSSTHDTLPLLAYLRLLDPLRRLILAIRVGVLPRMNDRAFVRGLVRALLRSPAACVIVALQDWLPIEDRINVPGTETPTADPNWRWRMPLPIERLPVFDGGRSPLDGTQDSPK